MPYATNQGVRLYYHVEGDGPPLVLLLAWMSNLSPYVG